MSAETDYEGPEVLGTRFLMDPDAVLSVAMGPAKFIAFTIEQMVAGLLKVDDSVDWNTFRLDVRPVYDVLRDWKTLQFEMTVEKAA